jgi:hypothetical protein
VVDEADNSMMLTTAVLSLVKVAASCHPEIHVVICTHGTHVLRRRARLCASLMVLSTCAWQNSLLLVLVVHTSSGGV